MKKLFFYLFYFFLINNLFSQQFIGIANLGFNLSQVDGDEIYGFRKFGVNVGPSVMYSFGQKNNGSSYSKLLLAKKVLIRNILIPI